MPHKISTLLYVFNEEGQVLLLRRNKEPNFGLWSPCGGKLKTETGESPYECARREAEEELGIKLSIEDFHLTGIISEHGYEGNAHWLMFLFEVKRPINFLPPSNSEGEFAFFDPDEIENLPLPQTDREMIWKLFWEHRNGFFSAHCHCLENGKNIWTIEESVKPSGDRRIISKQNDAADGIAPLNSDKPQLTEKGVDIESHHYFMGEALKLAAKAAKAGEVPVGAVIVREGKIIARAYNQVELLKDATAHAEMLALTQAQAAVGDWRLTDCVLYVTKEPCPMCAGAIVHTRIRLVVYGAPDQKAGAAGTAMNLLQNPNLNHRCQVIGGVRIEECRNLLKSFFLDKR
ncbi:MAG: tRNA adenosine(34) deaminase TadA [Verrucomicrobiia bacterium]|jgi:tRNA(Arg) A34 adenosine deaminase TadA/ADP-ribose pyrophosphatase YjhB (NUDIX family)